MKATNALSFHAQHSAGVKAEPHVACIHNSKNHRVKWQPVENIKQIASYQQFLVYELQWQRSTNNDGLHLNSQKWNAAPAPYVSAKKVLELRYIRVTVVILKNAVLWFHFGIFVMYIEYFNERQSKVLIYQV